jgi:DNA modification methylase
MLNYKFCNELLCMDGIEGMKMLPDESIPLVVTSPPWDKIRHYGGHPFHFEPMADQLWRVLMPGGVVCWHVADQIRKHTESGTSARQNLYFHKLGFCVNTLVIDVIAGNTRPIRRYGASLQYVFVLSKGRPRVFNPIQDIMNRYAGQKKRIFNRLSNGTRVFRREHIIPTHSRRTAIWHYATGLHHSSTDPDAFKHPALMPEQLAADLIHSWSTDGDVVLDPMCGSGTTAMMALLSNRRYLGFEIHRAYYDLAVKRLERATEKYVAAA